MLKTLFIKNFKTERNQKVTEAKHSRISPEGARGSSRYDVEITSLARY